MLKKILLFISCIVLTSYSINAQEPSSNKTTNEMSHSLVLQAAYPLAAKLGYVFNYKLPFLQGANPLTEGNNINFALSAEITPISLNGLAAAVWTPIAFLEFSLGGRIGTGWNINLFGGNIYGIGLNQNSGVNNIAENNGSAFDGITGKLLFGGAFQFDLAAIFPGDWNHVVFRTYHEINYHAYSRANAGESWFFENDEGENVNGFKYYSSYLLGYQIPLILNMVAFMAEAELNFYNIPDKSVWGGNLMQWMLSAVLSFSVHKQVDIMAAVQFRTRTNYIDADREEKYYRTQTVNPSKPRSMEFYRVAAIVTFKF